MQGEILRKSLGISQLKAKKDKFFLKYMVKIRMRFCALFKENNMRRKENGQNPC